MVENFPIELKKDEVEEFTTGFNKLRFHSDSELNTELQRIQNTFIYPLKNPKLKDWKKEQVLCYLLPRMDYLCYSYYLALKNNDPEYLLNGYYTHNNLNSTFKLSSGVDHSDRLRSVLECYAGNNYSLTDKYLPLEIGLSKTGHRFSVTAINLIFCIKNDAYKEFVIEEATIFLQKEKSVSDKMIITVLKSILEKDVETFSGNLGLVANSHKLMKWLNDFYNPIGKYLPLVAYALFSMAYRHLGLDFIRSSGVPASGLWWKGFSDFNIANNFPEGSNMFEFTGEFEFIDKIEKQPRVFSWV